MKYEICYDLSNPTKERRATTRDDDADWVVDEIEADNDLQALEELADNCDIYYSESLHDDIDYACDDYEVEESDVVKYLVNKFNSIDVGDGSIVPIYCKNLDTNKMIYNSGITFKSFHRS